MTDCDIDSLIQKLKRLKVYEWKDDNFEDLSVPWKEVCTNNLIVLRKSLHLKYSTFMGNTMSPAACLPLESILP